MKRSSDHDDVQTLLARETRLAPFVRLSWRLLLAYPAPYRVGMSSLGFLTLHREVSSRPQWSVERVFLPRAPGKQPLRAWESGDAATQFHAVGISIAHELEIASVARLLTSLGLASRRSDRRDRDPLVVIGGPLTGINPRPLAPLADLVVVGEADDAIHELCDALERSGDHDDLRAQLAAAEGFWWPASGTTPPPPRRTSDAQLPARSEIWSPDAELRDMALVEVSRGCKRVCAFCATSRLASGASRVVSADRVLGAIPRDAPRVGLVGAAVSDHPELREILRSLIAQGREVGLSSIRADRLDAELLELLHQAGLRTLTLGVDGLSERLRHAVKKSVTETTLLRVAQLAADAGLRRLKLYQLVGLPDEDDADLDEFIVLAGRLGKIMPLTVTISPFVPKPHTPLAAAVPPPVKEVERRLHRLHAGLRGRARVQPTSARWAWVEARIAQGDERTGEAVLEAWRKGNRYADYRKLLAE